MVAAVNAAAAEGDQKVDNLKNIAVSLSFLIFSLLKLAM